MIHDDLRDQATTTTMLRDPRVPRETPRSRLKGRTVPCRLHQDTRLMRRGSGQNELDAHLHLHRGSLAGCSVIPGACHSMDTTQSTNTQECYPQYVQGCPSNTRDAAEKHSMRTRHNTTTKMAVSRREEIVKASKLQHLYVYPSAINRVPLWLPAQHCNAEAGELEGAFAIPLRLFDTNLLAAIHVVHVPRVSRD